MHKKNLKYPERISTTPQVKTGNWYETSEKIILQHSFFFLLQARNVACIEKETPKQPKNTRSIQREPTAQENKKLHKEKKN